MSTLKIVSFEKTRRLFCGCGCGRCGRKESQWEGNNRWEGKGLSRAWRQRRRGASLAGNREENSAQKFFSVFAINCQVNRKNKGKWNCLKLQYLRLLFCNRVCIFYIDWKKLPMQAPGRQAHQSQLFILSWQRGDFAFLIPSTPHSIALPNLVRFLPSPLFPRGWQ